MTSCHTTCGAQCSAFGIACAPQILLHLGLHPFTQLDSRSLQDTGRVLQVPLEQLQLAALVMRFCAGCLQGERMSCFENNLSLKEMLKAILLSSDPDIKYLDYNYGMVLEDFHHPYSRMCVDCS